MPAIGFRAKFGLKSCSMFLCLLSAILFPLGLRARASESRAAGGPELQVEFLGCEKGFAVAGQSVTMLCVIRNVGTAELPENSARVRCYPLTGLDFMEG